MTQVVTLLTIATAFTGLSVQTARFLSIHSQLWRGGGLWARQIYRMGAAGFCSTIIIIILTCNVHARMWLFHYGVNFQTYEELVIILHRSMNIVTD